MIYSVLSFLLTQPRPNVEQSTGRHCLMKMTVCLFSGKVLARCYSCLLMVSREQTLIIEADEGGVKREWIRRGGERMRGGTGKQMLVQQHRSYHPSLIRAPPLPLPCPSVAPSLTFGPSNLCPLSPSAERLVSRSPQQPLWFSCDLPSNHGIVVEFFSPIRCCCSNLEYGCEALCTLFLSPAGITTEIVCVHVCMCFCVCVCAQHYAYF